MMIHAASFIYRVFYYLLRTRGKVQLTPTMLAKARQSFDNLLDAIGFQA
jgi:hypothetical protein